METFPIQAPAFNGNSRAVPASNAFEWLKQGWALFIVNPGLWIALTIVLLVILLGLNIVPMIGTLAANLLMPVLSAGMLLACQKVSNGEELEIADLFAGFKQNTGDMIMLGVLYMVAMLIIVVVVIVLGGGSMAGGVLMGRPAGVGLAFGGMLLAMLLSLVLSVPLFMAIWFAPALVFFHDMQPLAAMKASFAAGVKNWLAMFVFALLLAVAMFFAALPFFVGFLLLIPLFTGAIYASYLDIFEGA